MTYKQLRKNYPLAYEELIKQNQLKKWKRRATDNTSINVSCNWYTTPQGDDFWRDMYRNTDTSITRAKKLHPELFELTSAARITSAILRNQDSKLAPMADSTDIAMTVLLLGGNTE